MALFSSFSLPSDWSIHLFSPLFFVGMCLGGTISPFSVIEINLFQSFFLFVKVMSEGGTDTFFLFSCS